MAHAENGAFQQVVGGISSTNSVVNAIVASGYQNKFLTTEIIFYGHPTEHCKLSRSNLALVNGMEKQQPIRLYLGHKAKPYCSSAPAKDISCTILYGWLKRS